MRFPVVSHPILSAGEAKKFEAQHFAGDEEAEWQAMMEAGKAVGAAVFRDFGEYGEWPVAPRLLVVAGKGHNGGDALLAADKLLHELPGARAEVLFLFPERELRPLTARAFRQLVHSAPGRVASVRPGDVVDKHYEVLLDGVFGYQFRPPLDARVKEIFSTLRKLTVSLRVAVDLPSGLGDEAALAADATYATGILKAEVVERKQREVAGRLRYLDLGFFSGKAETGGEARSRVLVPAMLQSLRRLRPATADKRHYGHLLVMGGSRSYPGAIMMTVRAALRSGVGLLTAVVPESLVPAYAAHVPEAMWVGCPETPAGGLALEGFGEVRRVLERATALAIGPGLAREAESLALVNDILDTTDRPVVLDADALQPEVVRHGKQQKILTPHAGEFKRLAGDQSLEDYVNGTGVICVAKGSPTQIAQRGRRYLSVAGGPVLARGGSGDMLAGMIGGLLAQDPQHPMEAACTGVLWHGTAADCWARAGGATAVQSTELLNFLGRALGAGAGA